MKRVSLFVTCIVDMLFPDTGEATLDILENLGLQVDFPEAQTCCGQPAFNSGFQEESRKVARHFLNVFKDAEAIVTPSGSCASMVKHFYHELFSGQPEEQLAHDVAAKTWELTEFVVDVMGVSDLGTTLDQPVTAMIHDACHGLRGLNLSKQPRTLLANVKNLSLVDLPGHDQCCGFGGLFAVKMSQISTAMLNDKLTNISGVPSADIIITGDASCLMHMNGGLSRQNSPRKVVHIAEVLAGRV
jgi:L-lactate dehydrogenase complex protein LldE